MTFQTAIASSIKAYLACDDETLEERANQDAMRNSRLLRFPYAMMLLAALPEIDFANRWCWTHFGPADGNCTQSQSQYRACELADHHSHSGLWTNHWFVKTEYDFGFNEWYFARRDHYDRFVSFLPELNWGEKFPKS